MSRYLALALIRLLALGSSAVKALPHEVVPTPRSRNALSIALYVKTSVGQAHFVVVPSAAKVVPDTVGASDVIDPSHHETLKKSRAASGSFPVRAGERSSHVVRDLACGQSYDVFFIVEAANSNGLFGPVNRVLGVSTNGAAPVISAMAFTAADGRTNATELSLTMEARGVPCRVWYTVLPLRDTVLLNVEEWSPQEVLAAAGPDDIIDLPQGLEGELSPRIVVDGLESDKWYQLSAVSERAEGIFSEVVYSVAKTHREPPRVLEMAAAAIQGTTTSLRLHVRLDCSSAPMREPCGLLSYRVTELQARGAPGHLKPRQIAQGIIALADGQPTSHYLGGLSPGKIYSVATTPETPGSNGACGPSTNVTATTFPVAPSLTLFEASRSGADPSTVSVRYKASGPCIVHVHLSERIGHPLAMQAATIGNQHGMSFSRAAGREDGSYGTKEDEARSLQGSQELHSISAGSAFDIVALTESTLEGQSSGVFGVAVEYVLDAVPPLLAEVRMRPPNATATELMLEFEAERSAGRMYYALVEAEAATKGGKGGIMRSPDAVRSASEREAGVVTAGSILVAPTGGSKPRDRSSAGEASSSERQPLVFRNLRPMKRYVATLCTESNSGTFSNTVVAEAETYGEAPLVTEVTVVPADRSAEALTISVTLESAGLVHFVVRRAGEGAVPYRDHTIAYKGTREVKAVLQPARHQHPGGTTAVDSAFSVVQLVEGLEANSTYEVFLVTETMDSNGIYLARSEPLLARTHPVPPTPSDLRARAADASSSAIEVAVSLPSLAEVHYAVFPSTLTAEGTQALLDGSPSGSSTDNQKKLPLAGGCDNATRSDRGPATLNETAGLVASGVVLGTSNSSASPKHVDGAGAVLASASRIPIVLPSQETELDVKFRVNDLMAATAYDVCVFTETSGSRGLLGDVHEVRGVVTHASVPELASERVSCTMDCAALNRDSCWLEANKCGECYEGFDGKAGHVNSPCGKVPALTEADITRIIERERQGNGTANQPAAPAYSPVSGTAMRTTVGEEQRQRRAEGKVSDSAADKNRVSQYPDPRQIDAAMGRRAGQEGPTKLRRLLGVPFSLGPNATKFLYVEVPSGPSRGEVRDGADSNAVFDAMAAATELCNELRHKWEKQTSCVPTLATTLTSRYAEGRFHLEDDMDRPVLQVEVDTSAGNSLAFTLRHGDETGPAMVDFCSRNAEQLPDEQECVVTLMREIDL